MRLRWAAGMLAALVAPVWAQADPVLDPPHNATHNITCDSCHLGHHADLGAKETPTGNVNLCLTCHVPGGMASVSALTDADQAAPGPFLPANAAAAGTSHRWDSGISGRALLVSGIPRPTGGTVVPAGDYTGRFARVYSLTITTAGNAGAAQFGWSGTGPSGGSGAGVSSGPNVALSQGVRVGFVNGSGSPAFQVGDRWNVYVRSDLAMPTNVELLTRMTNGMMMCSTCHNQHSQQYAPFDTNAPAWTVPGTGEGRHFQRIADNSGQLCHECHGARFVTNSIAGSHPVGVTVPVNAAFRAPTSLPLDASHKVQCLTCHRTHLAPDDDGNLLRMTDRVAQCTQCHAQSDTATPAAHLSAATGVLWPGGTYGTTFPQKTDTTQRGACVNCHQPHGWPDTANLAADYPGLLVEREENLCYTCHDANGPANKRVKDDFAKTVHHPVVDTDPLRQGGRSVECTDCHNTHVARSVGYTYSTTATSTRNQITNPNRGASGVALNYGTLANFVAPSLGAYTATNSAAYEYQLCFKCHAGYAWLPGAPPKGLSANGSIAKPDETDLAQGFSPKNRSGHPVVTGLDNYVNSKGVGSPSKKGLTTTAMKAPWNTNVGTQTMLCSDCHNTDAASTAAQGPHGSAVSFMRRTLFTSATPGPTAWPDVPVENFTQSWCSNCHNDNSVHSEGNHAGLRCYSCHIVIPHGGKVSRLIADGDSATMPVRYAYNNDPITVEIFGFTKRPRSGTGSYNGDSDCNTRCTDHTAAAEDNW
jgi:predicted CXXCH cytochrome family protein